MDIFRSAQSGLDSKSETMGGTMQIGSPRFNEEGESMTRQIQEISFDRTDDLVRFGSHTRLSQYELNEILNQELISFETNPQSSNLDLHRILHTELFTLESPLAKITDIFKRSVQSRTFNLLKNYSKHVQSLCVSLEASDSLKNYIADRQFAFKAKTKSFRLFKNYKKPVKTQQKKNKHIKYVNELIRKVDKNKENLKKILKFLKKK